MSDARCVLRMPDVNSFCVRCQILCGWMPDVNSFCVRCLDNHCCTAGCQKLAGWPSVCKIKPRSSSDVFLCLLLTVILAEAKDLLYGLLCLQGIQWLSTCEMSVRMASKERSIFWNFLCWMHAAKSFPTGFAGDIQKQPLQWGLSGPQLQDARCRMWLFHTHCLAFFGNVSIFLPCLLFNRNCTLALWLCTLALKMFEAVPRCSAFTGVVSSDSWSSPCLRCAWPQITCLCSTVMSTTGNWHSFFMSHLTHLHLKRNIVQLTVYFHY